jgi:hypothetical protein
MTRVLLCCRSKSFLRHIITHIRIQRTRVCCVCICCHAHDCVNVYAVVGLRSAPKLCRIYRRCVVGPAGLSVHSLCVCVCACAASVSSSSRSRTADDAGGAGERERQRPDESASRAPAAAARRHRVDTPHAGVHERVRRRACHVRHRSAVTAVALTRASLSVCVCRVQKYGSCARAWYRTARTHQHHRVRCWVL